jgi:hypothetical protein
MISFPNNKRPTLADSNMTWALRMIGGDPQAATVVRKILKMYPGQARYIFSLMDYSGLRGDAIPYTFAEYGRNSVRRFVKQVSSVSDRLLMARDAQLIRSKV